MKRRAFVRITPWCLLFLAAPSAQTQPRYKITDLGTLGGGVCCTQAWGINRHGQAVGFSDPDGMFMKGFRTAPNAVIKPSDNLGGGPYGSSANAINSLGQVGGWVDLQGSVSRGIRGAANAPYNPADAFGTLGGDCRAFGINDGGQLTGYVGQRVFRTGPNAPFNAATDILDDWSWDSVGNGINNPGQIVGAVITSIGRRPFRTAPNAKLNPATDVLGFDGFGHGINDLGQITGGLYGPQGSAHAFRTAPGSPMNAPPEDLGTLGGSWASGLGINSSGLVVGLSTVVPDGLHAFLYIDGKMWDLNALVPPNSGWLLQEATAINEFGQIVGNGRFQEASRSFRLDPVHAYTLSLTYDPATARSSANLTIKVQLLDQFGVNVSSPAIALRALTIEQPGSAPRAVEDSARPDPGNAFRYDSKLVGYTFSFRVKSLPDGAYTLMFKAGNDPFPYAAPFTVR